MKQLLFLFLILLPCLAWAQYPSNGNQKITLGEQTTADGLIYRGVAATDTVRKPSIDTMAYMVLDTTTNIMWHYKKATSNAWLRVNGSISSGLTGILPVANGGTGQTTLAAAGINTGSGTINFIPKYTATGTTLGNSAISDNGTTITATNRSIHNTGNNNFIRVSNYFNIGGSGSDYGSIGFNIGYTTTNDTYKYLFGDLSSAIKFNGGGFNFFTAPSGITDSIIIYTERMRITNAGNVGIGTTTPQSGYRLHVVDSVYVGGNVSASAYTTRSDFNLKDDIFDLKYGLNDILQLQPVEYTYKSNGSKQLGFIAQDIGTILPEVVSFEDSMSVNYQAIIPILTKAIQEQQALIKALEQRLLILENK
jgi:hypothetical protein